MLRAPRIVLSCCRGRVWSEGLTRSHRCSRRLPNELFPVQPDGFEPFLVRLDRELLQVVEVSDAGWKVVRGYAGTKAAVHADEATVELFPVLWDRREKRLEDYQALVASSPFVLPAAPKTWSPKLAGVSDKTIRPGEVVSLTAKLDNADPELGVPSFAIEEAAEGMAIDAATGQFTWTPAESLQPGKYSAARVSGAVGKAGSEDQFKADDYDSGAECGSKDHRANGSHCGAGARVFAAGNGNG